MLLALGAFHFGAPLGVGLGDLGARLRLCPLLLASLLGLGCDLLALLIDLGLQPFVLGPRLELLLLELGLGIVLPGLDRTRTRLLLGLSLGLLEPALARQVLIVERLAGGLLRFAGDLAHQPAGRLLFLGFSHCWAFPPGIGPSRFALRRSALGPNEGP